MERRLTEEGKAWGRAALQFAQSIAAIPGALPKGDALGQPVRPSPSETLGILMGPSHSVLPQGGFSLLEGSLAGGRRW